MAPSSAIETILASNRAMAAGEKIGNALAQPASASLGLKVNGACFVTVYWGSNTKGNDLYKCATREFTMADSDTIQLPRPCAYVEVEVSDAVTLSAKVTSGG